jgi:hypothetical protein
VNVLDQFVHDPDVSHVAALLLALVDSTECTERRVPGLVGIETSRDGRVDLLFQVKPELVIELAFDPTPED